MTKAVVLFGRWKASREALREPGAYRTRTTHVVSCQTNLNVNGRVPEFLRSLMWKQKNL